MGHLKMASNLVINPADITRVYAGMLRNNRLSDNGAALQNQIRARRMGLTGQQLTVAQRPQQRVQQADPVAESRRFAATSQRGQSRPYGISGGGTDQFFDATAGGIKGRVNVLLQATEAISDAGTATIDADVAFSNNDQSRVGSVGRILEQLFVDIAVSGDLPAGYDADSLRRFLIGSTYIQPEIGGVPQVQIPVAAMIDTNFVDRSFKFFALLDPGNFASMNFNWNSDTIAPPAAPTGDTWTARLLITAVFSPPLRR